MLLDAVTYVVQFVDAFIEVYILAILLWVIASWVRLPYSLLPVQRFLDDVCGPYLRMWRRVLPGAGPLDFSPVVAIVALGVLRYFANDLLNRLH